MSGSTSVYRVYGMGWRLLYVGCSSDYKRRLKQHTRAEWYSDMVHVRVRVYPTREMALAIEERAISMLRPIYNQTGNPDFVPYSRWARLHKLNDADPKAPPIRSPETIRRWRRDGAPGLVIADEKLDDGGAND